MASELIIQTLKGPTSGSNANKIIVPSGQQLHPVDHVIKTQLHQWTNNTSTTSSSFVDISGSSFSYTPASASSKLLIQYTYAFYRASAASGSGIEVVLNIDGSNQNTVNKFEHYLGNYNYSYYGRGHKIDTYTNSNSSAKTLKLQFRNYDGSDRWDINESNYVSSIFVQEIAQ